MDEVTVRRATRADADAIADLIELNEPEFLVSEISRDERRDRFRVLLASEFNVAFVAEANGEVVGELTIVLRQPHPSELGFGVHPDWRRHGVGRTLVQHAVDWATQHHVHKLTAEVFPENTAALALLEELGFDQEAYLPNQFARVNSAAKDAVLLARQVA